MSEFAAIQGTFADFKLIKTRKLAQLVIEIPIEQADHALECLGGVPRSDMERWVAVARLNMSDASTREGGDGKRTLEAHAGEAEATTSATKPKREMTLANRIGMLCGDKRFQEYLKTEHPESVPHCSNDECKDCAEYAVERLCNVTSLSDIKYDEPKSKVWKIEIYEPFQAWLEKQS